MTKLTKWLALASLLSLGACAYPAQQMIEVPATPAFGAAEATPDPVCDDPVERAESADLVGDAGEDFICALTAKMTAGQ